MKDLISKYGWLLLVTILVIIMVNIMAPSSNRVGAIIKNEIIGDTEYYTVVLEANGGELSQEKIMTISGREYGYLPTPVNGDLIFIGWYTQIEGGERITSYTKYDVSHGTTLYALYKTSSYVE